MQFEDFKLNRQLLNSIEEAGFVTPTEVQIKAIPRINSGQDVLCIAQTGTGKTAAYILPMLMKIKYAQGDNPRVLVLVPTRELVLQVVEQIHELSTYLDVRVIAAYGGIGMKTQIEQLNEGCDIIVATPGRLRDLFNKEALELKEIKTFILDEVDRILDMGFVPQVQWVTTMLPRKRQNLFFSATFTDKVEKLAEDFIEFPQRIDVTPVSSTAETIEQHVYHVPNFQTKINLLKHVLKDEEEFKRVIIFAKTKQTVENITSFLQRKGAEGEVRAVHSNKGQNTRINSINDFKAGEIRFLVATDVAARGIDVSQVSHVINFDVPVVYQDYVHRVGRTGRAKNSGVAITFATDAEKYHVGKIEELIDKPINVIPFPEDVEVVETEFEESQAIKKELDNQRKREDPSFKGAFHDKQNNRFRKKLKEEKQKQFIKNKKKNKGGGKKRRR